ncbi:hypothetical protein FKW77_006233 [Venturia effusa]|uniref:Uncharacterized protein n=1 Tax=Venturia effusa TaxID=50376 RepID=A0A517LQB9_9PEZI|nr:hypothetical protein FKW77_006233 [Venturia effusa]
MATSTLQQQPVSLNDTPVEPLQSNGASARHDLTTTLAYVDPSVTEEQFEAADKKFGSNPNTYREFGKELTFTIEDVADRGGDFSLDKEGFTYVKHASALKEEDFEDEEKVMKIYRAEVAELVKKVTGAPRVHVFNTMSRVSRGKIFEEKASNEKHGQNYRVHVDQNNIGVEKVIRDNCPPEELEELFKKRVQIINVWRPIRQIFRDPFGVADLTTQDPDNILTLNVYTKDGVCIPTLGCRVNTKHHWYYKYAQKPDDVLMFLQFDSKIGGHCYGRVPHSAFKDMEYEDAEPRRSIEARALVFYDEESKDYRSEVY